MTFFDLQPRYQLFGRYAVAKYKHSVHLIFSCICFQIFYQILTCDFQRFFPDNFYGFRQMYFIFSHRKIIHLLRQFCQEFAFPLSFFCIPDHCRSLTTVQHSITGCAVADTSSQEFLFSRKCPALHHSCCQDHSGRLIHLAGCLHCEVFSHSIYCTDPLFGHGDSQLVKLLLILLCQFLPADLRQSRIILYLLRPVNFLAAFLRAKQQDLLVAYFCCNRSRDTCRSCTDNGNIIPVHILYTFLLSCRGVFQ